MIKANYETTLWNPLNKVLESSPIVSAPLVGNGPWTTDTRRSEQVGLTPSKNSGVSTFP